MSKRIVVSDRDYELIKEIMGRENIDSIKATISYLINEDDMLNYKKPKTKKE
jgi:hypothetical protein